MESLLDYVKKLQRTKPRDVTVGNKIILRGGFTICKTTKRKGQIGFGYRRSLYDRPIKGQVIGSYTCLGGGGYFMRRLDNDKIIQVQSFRKKGEK
jgi:hypothetical protein